jgi:hypothetical protein
MAGKSKLLQKNKNKEFFQHGLVKTGSKTDWRDWLNPQAKQNAINACKNKK